MIYLARKKKNKIPSFSYEDLVCFLVKKRSNKLNGAIQKVFFKVYDDSVITYNWRAKLKDYKEFHLQ